MAQVFQTIEGNCIVAKVAPVLSDVLGVFPTSLASEIASYWNAKQRSVLDDVVESWWSRIGQETAVQKSVKPKL